MKQKEISLVVGPRQAGKTTLMRLLQEDLNKAGEKTLFLSLDTETDRPFFQSQPSLLKKIELEVGRGPAVVFIDEIQRKENAGIFLKGLYDMNLPYKFVVSGSGSVELKERVHESLVGRKRLFEMSTVSFGEFIDFRLDYKYSDKLMTFLVLHPEKGRELLNEYLNFGGYPRVILAETMEEKRLVIAEIFQSYLEKDIAYLLGIQKTDSLIGLVKILASQAGGLVNSRELSVTLGLSVQKVKDYLWYLEKTFVIRRLTPYHKNLRKELTKMGVIYFVDLGMKNYAIGQFGVATRGAPQGLLFENFVFNNLHERVQNKVSRLHFWRTQDKAEVDFVISAPDELIPVEVKYQTLERPKITRSYRSFLANYQPKRGYIVHLGKSFEAEFDKAKISFVPYFKIGDIVEGVS